MVRLLVGARVPTPHHSGSDSGATTHPDTHFPLATSRLCPSVLQVSADRALVVAEHERRLDHVRQRRHLRVAEYHELMKIRIGTLGEMKQASWEGARFGA